MNDSEVVNADNFRRMVTQLERVYNHHETLDVLLHDPELNSEFKDHVFYTGDLIGYSRENGEIFMYIGSGEHNPVKENLPRAVRDISASGFYVPTDQEVGIIKDKAEEGLIYKIALSEVGGKLMDAKYGEFQVDVKQYLDFLENEDKTNPLNPAQNLIVEKTFAGYRENLVSVFKELANANIGTVKVGYDSKGYVEHMLGLAGKSETEDGMVIRLPWLAGSARNYNTVLGKSPLRHPSSSAEFGRPYFSEHVMGVPK